VGICAACGNEYAATFEVRPDEMSVFVSDSFECAIQLLAPTCAHCGIRVIGHGVQANGIVFCCAHCARSVGSPGPIDRVEAPRTMQRDVDSSAGATNSTRRSRIRSRRATRQARRFPAHATQ
jgi:hypothetical protein